MQTPTPLLHSAMQTPNSRPSKPCSRQQITHSRPFCPAAAMFFAGPERFGPIGDGVADGLRLRHDHGSNYLADDFQQEVAFFGIESSPSFVREPEGNGVAERFIRTLKENLLWVRSFETIEDLRLALLAFKRTYNEQGMLAKYDYRSPAQSRAIWSGRDAWRRGIAGGLVASLVGREMA